MGKIISLGKWNSSYFVLLLSIIFNILNQCFYGMNNNEAFETIKFFKKSQLSNHIFIHFFFNYLFIFLFQLIINLYNFFKNKKKTNNSNRAIEKYQLIHTNSEKERKNSKVVWKSLLIYLLWCVEEFCLQCFIVFFKDIDFWMFELFFFIILNSILFNMQIYNHQLLASFINIFSLILKIVSIALTLNSEERYAKFENDLPILYTIKSYILIAGLLLYLLLILFRSYVNIQLKWLIEKKFISINKILVVYGFIGLICSAIGILASSPVSCAKEFYQRSKDNNYKIFDYICKFNETNSTKEYLTNFNDYFFDSDKKWEYETAAILFWAITFSLFKYCSLMIIKNLSPAHLIFSIPIAFFFQKIISIIYSVKDLKFFKKESKEIHRIKFSLDILGDVIAVVALLIYLEIIVLHFGNFDYNIKVNIMRRASQDIKNEPDETIYSNDIEPILNEDKEEEEEGDINEYKDIKKDVDKDDEEEDD